MELITDITGSELPVPRDMQAEWDDGDREAIRRI